ncbi:hypothetical protein ACFWXH_02920 [Mesorhizobium sp. NPDC059054]|uniref:hypothetical protein n=1 Tax=Mesorhizobium sp. NPDC059054 TaxID=3346711 RepID=UPI003684E1D3
MSYVSYSLERHQKSAAFLVTATLFFCVHQAFDISIFYYDSDQYWLLAGQLLDFPATYRGYFSAFLFFPTKIICDTFPILGLLPFRLGSSIAYALFFAVLLPDVFVTLFGGCVSFSRRLLAPVLFCCLFPGLLLYPLTDLPAVALLVSAAWCLLRSIGASRARQIFLVLLSGFLAYGAYNTRTIYAFSFAFLIGILFVAGRRKKTIFGNWLALTTVFLMGAAIAAVPQIIINKKRTDTLSPFVGTDIGGGSSLFAKQLVWGITLQRYETSVDEGLPGASLYYLDPAGEKFFQEQSINASSFKVSEYIILALNNPIDIIGIVGRHLINGLDVRDGMVYTRTLSSKKGALSVLNFLVLFGAVLVLLAPTAKMNSDRHAGKTKLFFWIAYFLLPVAAILPGAVETRFFLPLHLLIYSVLAFRFDYRMQMETLRRHWFAIALALVASASIYFAVTQSTMASLKFTYPTQYRGM